MAEQNWNPETYAQNARFVSDLGEPLLELLQPVAGEKVLDLGCGDGALTEKLVAAGCQVIGVDASAEQAEAARRLGLEVQVCRAEALPFKGEFDAVFSNAVLHWVKDQSAALAKIYQSLKPGGRFIAELGGAGCVATVRESLHEALRARGMDPWAHDPWFFVTVEEYSALLKEQGFEIDSIILFPRPTPIPGDISGWLETFGRAFLLEVPFPERDALIAEVRERARPKLFDPEKGWVIDYTRLRMRAVRPLANS